MQVKINPQPKCNTVASAEPVQMDLSLCRVRTAAAVRIRSQVWQTSVMVIVLLTGVTVPFD